MQFFDKLKANWFRINFKSSPPQIFSIQINPFLPTNSSHFTTFSTLIYSFSVSIMKVGAKGWYVNEWRVFSLDSWFKRFILWLVFVDLKVVFVEDLSLNVITKIVVVVKNHWVPFFQLFGFNYSSFQILALFFSSKARFSPLFPFKLSLFFAQFLLKNFNKTSHLTMIISFVVITRIGHSL